MERGGRGNGARVVGCGDVGTQGLWMVMRKEGIVGGWRGLRVPSRSKVVGCFVGMAILGAVLRVGVDGGFSLVRKGPCYFTSYPFRKTAES